MPFGLNFLIMVGLSPHQISVPRLLAFVQNFCHVFWTISTPNFNPKATSNHELWRANASNKWPEIICIEISQSSLS